MISSVQQRVERELTGKEGPGQHRTAHSVALDDFTVADGTAGTTQSVAEDGQEDNRRDDTLESEEVLDLRLSQHTCVECPTRTVVLTFV